MNRVKCIDSRARVGWSWLSRPALVVAGALSVWSLCVSPGQQEVWLWRRCLAADLPPASQRQSDREEQAPLLPREVVTREWRRSPSRPLLIAVGTKSVTATVLPEWRDALVAAGTEEVASDATGVRVVRASRPAGLKGEFAAKAQWRAQNVQTIERFFSALSPEVGARLRGGRTVPFPELSQVEKDALREVVAQAEGEKGPIADAVAEGREGSYLGLHLYPGIYVYPDRPSPPLVVESIPMFERLQRAPPPALGINSYSPGHRRPRWLTAVADAQVHVVSGASMTVDQLCAVAGRAGGCSIVTHRQLRFLDISLFSRGPVKLGELLDGLLLAVRGELRRVNDLWFLAPLNGLEQVALLHRATSERLRSLASWTREAKPWPGFPPAAVRSPIPSSFEKHPQPRPLEGLTSEERAFLVQRLGAERFGALTSNAEIEFVNGFTLELYAIKPTPGFVTRVDKETGHEEQVPVREAVQQFHHVF